MYYNPILIISKYFYITSFTYAIMFSVVFRIFFFYIFQFYIFQFYIFCVCIFHIV